VVLLEMAMKRDLHARGVVETMNFVCAFATAARHASRNLAHVLLHSVPPLKLVVDVVGSCDGPITLYLTPMSLSHSLC
jgi:hypothetical protein